MAIGQAIRDYRLDRGWGQAELARRMGVEQQTVSRWERGRSRPRRQTVLQLARVLGLRADDLMEAAGYEDGSAAKSVSPRRAVRPTVAMLPLADLSSERFEVFIADLVQLLRPTAKVHRYGTQGHTQQGVDIVAYQGSRVEATYQCKRYKKFGPDIAQRAIDSVEVGADEHFLVLSRTASPAVRLVVEPLATWTVWDIDDISRIVRALPTESAVKLVDAHFPNWRADFLGVAEAGPWLDSDEFFRFFSGERLYTHDYELVGRSADVDGVLKWITEGAEPVALLVGRGGIGKSRLLRAIAERAAAQDPRITVRFAAPASEISPSHLELLSDAKPLVVVVDDAHDRADLADLVAGLERVRPGSKLLLASRPYAITDLAYDLRRVGLHPDDMPSWELSDLTAGEAEELAVAILGSDSDRAVVRRLAALTTDCPLITVVGAGLIARGQLDAERLERAASVRAEILGAFRDAIAADSSAGDAGTRGSVLDAVSLLQPIRTGADEFHRAFEYLTGLPFDRVLPHLRALEDAGVLLRRGGSLRIVPDLLGDVVLSRACFDERSGTSTGYIERARQGMGGETLRHLFVNASRVDWQVQQDRAGAVSLSDTVWDAVEDEFRLAGINGRRHLLELVRRVAFYQPERALALVRWAIDNPTHVLTEEEEAFSSFYRPSYGDVLQECPPVLKYVGYNIDHLRDTLRLLWHLARHDRRPTNQHPNHAMRVLSDWGSFEAGKPLEFNRAVLDEARSWFDSVTDDGPSPFEVLEPMLATEGMDHSASDMRTISFRPFAVDVTAVRPLRDEVVDLAFAETRSPNVRRAVRAINAIGKSLHGPVGLMARRIDEEESAAWTPVFLKTLDKLAEVAADETLDPLVGVTIRDAVSWHSSYSTTATQDAARRVVNSIPTSTEHELALLMHDGWGRLFDHVEDYETAERMKQERFDDLVADLTSGRSDDAILDLVAQRLEMVRRTYSHGGGQAGPFVWALIEKQPSLAPLVCDRVESDTESPLLEVVSIALACTAESDPEGTVPAARRLLALGADTITRQVAHAFGWGRGPRAELVPGEFELLEELATHADPQARKSVVRAASAIAKSERTRAVELAISVRFVDSDEVATELLALFGKHGELSWADLSGQHTRLLLDQLRTCPSINDYHITGALAELSASQPDEVVKLLKARVEASEETDRSIRDFDPLPYRWDDQLAVSGHAAFITILRDLRDWIAARPDSWQRQHRGADVFAAVAGTYDDRVLGVLEEGLQSGDANQIIAVAAILRSVPRAFVWTKVHFVKRALAAAQVFGDEYVRKVGSGLHAAVTSGGRMGAPGEPFPEDLEQRTRSAEVAAGLARGSIEERFYRSLEEAAVRAIEWEADRDAELMDDREW